MTSPTANLPAVVNVTAPVNGATFTAGSSVTITANATDTDGTISKVEFFNGTTLLGQSLTSPYSFAWANVPAGNYSLSVKATDNQNAVTTSAGVAISVTSTTTNQAPLVSLTSPSNNTTTTASSVKLTANANDSDGNITKVEFFNGNTKLGEDTTSPYSLLWSATAVNCVISAKATDNAGAVTWSASASVTFSSKGKFQSKIR